METFLNQLRPTFNYNIWKNTIQCMSYQLPNSKADPWGDLVCVSQAFESRISSLFPFPFWVCSHSSYICTNMQSIYGVLALTCFWSCFRFHWLFNWMCEFLAWLQTHVHWTISYMSSSALRWIQVGRQGWDISRDWSCLTCRKSYCIAFNLCQHS